MQDKQKITERIKKFSGSIVSEEFVGLQKLAYPIKQNAQGIVGAIRFDLESTHLDSFKKECEAEHSFLRFVVTQYTEPSAKIRVKPHTPKQTAPTDTPQQQERKPVDVAELENRIEEVLDQNVA